ncbi:hypothetical protein D3C72_1593090 [compost metagenome]
MPMPSMSNCVDLPLKARLMPRRSGSLREVPINRIRPSPSAACSSKARALTTARSARWPASGINDGLSASSRLRLVDRSSDSGTRVWALPA